MFRGRDEKYSSDFFKTFDRVDLFTLHYRNENYQPGTG